MHSPGRDLHQEQQVDAAQADRVHVQEVAGQDALGLRSEELSPGRPGPSRHETQTSLMWAAPPRTMTPSPGSLNTCATAVSRLVPALPR